MTSPGQSLSKLLSLVLRHEPEAIGISLDRNGWASVDELLQALAAHGRPLARAELVSLVAGSDKRRFALNAAGTMIRANQGHSVPVDLALTPVVPPAALFHGTVERYLSSIRTNGLVKGKRHHVHLSDTRELAVVVGKRRGEPRVLEVDARAMVAAGLVFYRSENGVWLTNHVPARFLKEDPRAG